jgi:hypothetical protein
MSRSNAVCLAAVLMVWSGSARGATVEDLVSPGAVIEAHAEFESKCGQCHIPFDRPGEDRLCMDCHEDVASDRERGRGFHGRSPGVLEASCRSCHPEHRGRGADAIGLDAGTFDHRYTDYPLEGAHRALECASCHPAAKLHREAPADCVGCHREDDPHREELGTDCGDCHSEVAWRGASFDHGKTEFSLRGAHVDAPCALCHADERFAATPKDCSSCHFVDDVHEGRFGAACQDCHDEASWKKPVFDHEQQTSFALSGGHLNVACGSCHPGSLFQEEIATECASCHADDDAHRGERSKTCENCHSVATWADREFDHQRDTSFALVGRHEKVRCRACHDGVLYESKTPTDCASCHAKDDVHEGQLKQSCDGCHVEAGWSQQVAFDHQLTRFPLLGLHRAVTCEECHASHAFRDAEPDCATCHSAHDAHERRLGGDCATCHNPNGWERWRFDHDAETAFTLHGAHAGADCLSCHQKPVVGAIELPRMCADCHALDDRHDGAFGADCAKCHVEKSWSEVTLPR